MPGPNTCCWNDILRSLTVVGFTGRAPFSGRSLIIFLRNFVLRCFAESVHGEKGSGRAGLQRRRQIGGALDFEHQEGICLEARERRFYLRHQIDRIKSVAHVRGLTVESD